MKGEFLRNCEKQKLINSEKKKIHNNLLSVFCNYPNLSNDIIIKFSKFLLNIQFISLKCEQNNEKENIKFKYFAGVILPKFLDYTKIGDSYHKNYNIQNTEDTKSVLAFILAFDFVISLRKI